MKLGLAANFLYSLREGSLNIARDWSPSINFTADGGFRIIDNCGTPVNVAKGPDFIQRLSKAKDLARNLRQENITLEVRLHGEPVLRLRKKANPKIVGITTMSGNIEITDLRGLRRTGSAFGQRRHGW